MDLLDKQKLTKLRADHLEDEGVMIEADHLEDGVVMIEADHLEDE